jgi:hypothetical protein
MIEVLKQALTDAKRNERHNNVAETRYWLNQYKLIAEQAIAKLESQEPVATIAVRWHEPVGKVAYVLEVNLPVGVHKLYTHPPRRTWVGLTDEEIEEGIKQSWVTEQAFQSAAWWAEAKLKQKNGFAEENT